MKTKQSRRYFDLMMGVLNKAAEDFKEELHPRDRSGRFSSKPGGGVATMRGPKSLAREASALRAIGEISQARVIEERLRRMRGGAPAQPKAPAPPAAAKPTPPGFVSDPARKKLPKPKEAQVSHEKMRIRNAWENAQRGGRLFNDVMRQRMRAIGKPEKMMWFAEALESENHHALAQMVRGKLLEMGYDLNGNPVKKAEGGAARPAPPALPPPAPRPAHGAQRPVPRPAPKLPPLDPPTPAQRSHEVMRIANALRKADIGGGRVSWDKFKRDMRIRMGKIKDPAKMWRFAHALSRSGIGPDRSHFQELAGEAGDLLRNMGYGMDGKPVSGGKAQAAMPPEPPPKPAKPAKPPKAQKAREERKPAPGAGKGLERARAGAKHRMSAVNTNLDLLDGANEDFSKNVKQIKRLGAKEGIGKTFKMTLADGSRAIYKPKNGTGLQRHHDQGADVRRTIKASVPEMARERAAFMISNAAGFDVIPYVGMVDYKDVPGDYKGKGHVMAWVEGKAEFEVGSRKMREEYRSDNPDLHRIAAMDFITCNTDRHGGNFMRGTDGRWYGIDNGLAFCADQKTGEHRSKPHKDLEGHSIPLEVQREIKSIDADFVRREMKAEGFPEIDIQGTIDRLNHLKGMTKWGYPYDDMRKVKGA